MELLEILIAVGVSLITFFIGYGVMLQKVKTLQKDVANLEADDKESVKLYTQILVTLAEVKIELKHLTEKINSKE